MNEDGRYEAFETVGECGVEASQWRENIPARVVIVD